MTSADILTLTVNPALDKSATFEGLAPEKKIRCSQPRYDAGGGGINVSKAIHRLEGSSLCIFTSGGDSGKRLEQIVDAEGLTSLPIMVKAETRESFVARDVITNAQYRFGFPGDPLSSDEVKAVLEAVRKQKANYVVASGSLNEGLSSDFLIRVSEIARENGSKFILDTSGDALADTLKSGGVYLAKPNIGELARLIGVESIDVDEADDAVLEIIEKGWAQIVVVSLGPQGAVLVSREETYFVPAPNVRKRTTVGAGDSMVGGMVWALSQGKTLKEVAKWGVACGSAATMGDGTQLFRAEDARRLYGWLEKRI